MRGEPVEVELALDCARNKVLWGVQAYLTEVEGWSPDLDFHDVFEKRGPGGQYTATSLFYRGRANLSSILPPSARKWAGAHAAQGASPAPGSAPGSSSAAPATAPCPAMSDEELAGGNEWLLRVGLWYPMEVLAVTTKYRESERDGLDSRPAPLIRLGLLRDAVSCFVISKALVDLDGPDFRAEGVMVGLTPVTFVCSVGTRGVEAEAEVDVVRRAPRTARSLYPPAVAGAN